MTESTTSGTEAREDLPTTGELPVPDPEAEGAESIDPPRGRADVDEPHGNTVLSEDEQTASGATVAAEAGTSVGAGDPGDERVVGQATPAADELDGAAAPAVTRGTRARQLEREGEVAADFLETLLDIADLDGDIEVDIDGDRAAVAIVDSEEGRVPRRLVGDHGKVLEALQELTRLAVQTATGERSRLMLDVAGHRAARRTVLVELARAAIARVEETGQRKVLDDMTAFERKVVHDEVAAAGLESESEGVEPHRHIVILPT